LADRHLHPPDGHLHGVMTVPDLVAGRRGFPVRREKPDRPRLYRPAVHLDRAVYLGRPRVPAAGQRQQGREEPAGRQDACAAHERPPSAPSETAPQFGKLLTPPPPFIVPSACQVLSAMELVMNCTEPSHMTTLPPPVCRLRAALNSGVLALTGMA